MTFAWTAWMVFGQRQQEISIMSTAVAMVTSRLICPLKKKNGVKILRWTVSVKVTFMLYADFESILKPVDER